MRGNHYWIVPIVTLLVCGCHQGTVMFVGASAGPALDLAPIDLSGGSAPEPPAIDPPEAQPAPPIEPPATQPASQPSTQPSPRRYTSPSPAAQQLILAAGIAQFAAPPELTGAGKEVSESVALGSQGAIGRSGLTTGSTTIAGAVTSQSGLGNTSASNLGFASGNTIFTARPNPASGPNGRCQELVRVGLSPSPAACMTSFRGGKLAHRR